jgi:conflict system STAND superfamily ATPase
MSAQTSPETAPAEKAVKKFNPYVGPRPFSKQQELPNRHTEVRDVADLLVSERVLLLHALSGAGKTSLIQAGVLGLLKGFCVLGPVRVDKPVPVNEDGSLIHLHNRYVYSIALSLLGDDSRPDESLYEMNLLDVLKRATTTSAGKGLPLLIIDQFEEILTLDPTDVAAKEEFFDELGGVVASRELGNDGLADDNGWPGTWLLLAIRDDQVGALDPYLHSIPGFLRARYRLSFLTHDEAKDAIQIPARAQGVTITDEAAEELIDRLSHTRVRTPEQDAAQSLPTHLVEPVQLQVLCRRLWKEKKHEGPFDKIDYEYVSGLADDYVERAMSRYYSDSISELAREFGIQEKAVRDWFETALITEHGDRAQSNRGPIPGPEEKQILARLKDMFLINEDSRGGTTWYELAHDRLVPAVKIANRAWRYKHLAPWQLQALDWKQSNRNSTYLLAPNQLPYSRGRDLSPLENEFRRACMEHYGNRFRIVRWQLFSGFLIFLMTLEFIVILGFLLAWY